MSRKNRSAQEESTKGYKLLRYLKPKTDNQEDYIRTIAENEIVICDGPAGCGKTHIAVGMACEYLAHGKVAKIVITRPVVEAGKSMGFLPGDLQEKIHPFLVPILEFMYDFFGRVTTEQLIRTSVIDVVPLNFMRGRTFNDSFMILDEAQNATLDEAKLFLTRLGFGSKCIINGDSTQSDLEPYEQKSFETLLSRLNNIEGVGISKLHYQDIIRNPIISKILKFL